MLDTVWLKLTAVAEANEPSVATLQYTMFGTGGVNKFVPHDSGTMLSNGIVVKETPEYIFNAISVMRGTVGRFDGNIKREETEGESETSGPEDSVED